MDSVEQALRDLTLAPYIVKAMALIGIRRRGGSNMFRHQLSTMAILLDYKMIDPVLLKASVIHDLFEDVPTMPGVTKGSRNNKYYRCSGAARWCNSSHRETYGA
jgi:(p)ppGpp synthase/HD superfamily hydrolase